MDEGYFSMTLTLVQWETVCDALAAHPAPEVRVIGSEIYDCLPDPEVSPLHVEPEVLSGKVVRELLMVFRDGMTISEMVAELQAPRAKIMSFIKPMILSGTVLVTPVGTSKIYSFVAPANGTEPGREDRRPPEKDPPAFVEARATGMPVRIRTERQDRKGRSTPGQRQKLIQRDRAYERQQAARKAAMETQMAKQQKEPKWKRKKK